MKIQKHRRFPRKISLAIAPLLLLAVSLMVFPRVNQADGLSVPKSSKARSSAVTVMNRPAGAKSIAISVAAAATAAATTSHTQAVSSTPVKTSVIQAPKAITTSTNPSSTLSPQGMSLYVDPSLAATGGPTSITSQATASWLGSWSGDIQATTNSIVSAAAAQNGLATLVAYNIPGRDCGGYSAGGLNSSDAYKTWIRQLAAGIGNRKVIVILEPDALGQISCLSPSDQAARYANLADAVNVLTTQTKAFVYLDAGHPGWIDASTMASELIKAGISQARGFSLNVSNFISTSANKAYGDQISALTGNKKYVIDTSRNGQGSNGDWCNPSGRGLGQRPTTSVGGNIDAYLWVKIPGESDGTCNGGPAAGQWWEAYAESLVANSI